jgi:hypothetical protein
MSGVNHMGCCCVECGGCDDSQSDPTVVLTPAACGPAINHCREIDDEPYEFQDRQELAYWCVWHWIADAPGLLIWPIDLWIWYCNATSDFFSTIHCGASNVYFGADPTEWSCSAQAAPKVYIKDITSDISCVAGEFSGSFTLEAAGDCAGGGTPCQFVTVTF